MLFLVYVFTEKNSVLYELENIEIILGKAEKASQAVGNTSPISRQVQC
jgi:hypothetical protein